AKFKEKAWIRVQAFFCMAHRREGREASTGFDKTPAFWTANGGPQGERSESPPLSLPNLKRKPGFASRLFFMAHRREGCAQRISPLSNRDSHFRRLSTSLTSDFLTLS
uniref:hypothetical protein n=1 Tax=Serratia marcescens TaxID=615 RepID=UPI001952C6B5